MDPIDEFFSALWKFLIFTLSMEALSHFFPTSHIEWLPDWIERAFKYAVWGLGLSRFFKQLQILLRLNYALRWSRRFEKFFLKNSKLSQSVDRVNMIFAGMSFDCLEKKQTRVYAESGPKTAFKR